MSIKRFLLLVFLAALLIPGATAHAANDQVPPNYCWPTVDPEKCLGVGKAILVITGELSLNVAVGVAKIVDGMIWLLDRAAAFMFDVMVQSDWLLSIKDELLASLASMMPGILRDVVLGSSGLMYIAMALAGLLMILPLVGAEQTRLVRPERVMLWGVLLAVLFIGGSSSAMGYDLVNAVEGLRLEIMTNIIGATENPADKLILSPMSATSRDFDSGNLLQLPTAYESRYFPEVEQIEVTIINIPGVGLGPVNAFVETKNSAEARASLAGSSIFFSFISLLGAYALLLFAITFAFLGVAALVLILFLFAALPLGFFEFGNVILKNILEKYMQVVVFSLGVSVFIRWVIGWISGFPDASDVPSALTWASLLLVVVAVLHVILGGAFNTLISSAQVFSGSVQAVLSGGGANFMGGAAGALGSMPLGGSFQGGANGAQERGNSVASSLVGGALSAVGFHAVSSALREPEASPPKRGDVFQDDARIDPERSQAAVPAAVIGAGAGGKRPGRQGKGKQDQQHERPRQDPQRPPVDINPFSPNPAQSETTLQTLAGREGWQEQQIQMIRTVAKRPIAEDQAVHSLASAPGFERSTDEAIQQALRAAQTLGPQKREEKA